MIYYKVFNKQSKRTEILTQSAINILKNSINFDKRYEVKAECDQHGREFNYNNFLDNVTTGTAIIQPQEIQGKNEGGNGQENPGNVIEAYSNSGSEKGDTVQGNKRRGRKPNLQSGK